MREGAWKQKNASAYKSVNGKEVTYSGPTYQAVAIHEIMWIRSLIGGLCVNGQQDADADARDAGILLFLYPLRWRGLRLLN